ncbi:ester cyclase [Bailinhaonella thermotolerans]|uniref:Ester cyclase n=1 Tax=Bailinhaonella thermotolerans TaxID=1070861 RepID=A0A3A4ACF5_9ACTN|nr:ester cyclase [Bailinhaonella thermotolerans]RJL24234.1 hypothetical protein D5H75_30825 [Bailinhaonella thermotolerans]
MSESSDALKDLYRRWLSDVWTGDFDAMRDIVTSDAVGHWPTQDVHGPDGFAAQIRQSHEYFHGIRTNLDVGPFVEGDLVAARWTFYGSYRGGIPGATAPEGTEVAFTGHDIFRAEGDRFAEYWVVSDVLGMMTRLGAIPS